MPDWTFELSARSRVIDLGFVLSDAMPRVPNVPAYSIAAGARHDDIRLDDGTSGCNETIVLGTHMGSHLDGLSHVSFEGRIHGGTTARSAQTDTGVAAHDMTTVPPFVTPGVLFDLAATRGEPVVRDAHEIKPDDLAPLVTNGLDDAVVLIRTGWGRLWEADAKRYAATEEARPGLGPEAAEWLADQGVRAVGTDSFTIELWPRGGRSAMPAHRVLLVDRGVFVFEALNLEELGSLAPTNFLFVALPLRLAGGSGSPVRPVAILSADEDGDDQ